MTDYLYSGKTATGQYYTEPTFKLLDVMKPKCNRPHCVRPIATDVARFVVCVCLLGTPCCFCTDD